MSMLEIRKTQLATLQAVTADIDKIEKRLRDVGLDGSADTLGPYSHVRSMMLAAKDAAERHVRELEREPFGPHEDHDDPIPGCPGCDARMGEDVHADR